MDENEFIQTERINLSIDEDTATQYYMSDQYVTEDAEAVYGNLNQFVVFWKEWSDTVLIELLNYDVHLPEPSTSMLAKLGSIESKHNVSVATKSYHSQTGAPHKNTTPTDITNTGVPWITNSVK